MRARKANLADLSDVALLKRLRKSKAWLHALCVELFREQGVAASAARGFQVRTFDATTVKESGRTGSLWRLHYSVSLPSLVCDFFKLTATEGPGTSKSFTRFRIREGDCILAGRGYSTAVGIQQVAAGGHVTVRVNRGALPLQTESGRVFDLGSAVSELGSAGAIGVWPTQVAAKRGPPVTGRVCAIRKTEQAIKIALASIGTEAGPKGRQVKPSNLQCTRHVIVFTTFPASEFPGRLRPGVVSRALAGGTRVPAVQGPGEPGTPAEIRRGQRPGVVLREAPRSAAGGEADPPRDRHFSLGIRLGGVCRPHSTGRESRFVLTDVT